ncbi:polyketide synthase dehydratase domain-containing protein [Desulfogranum mediterraneum]|uniref:polyketide synthase dehydratase domain-containing protein n=1 Tax=Desulfogranum mediterraneum TaxID=160661 RepID=UPI000414EBB4|nr:polyketide synthase dehydratase domain-containing protein [Desulfogranum mediterraneum]
MACQRLELSIPIRPWFSDHCFQDRVVLPAVETILILAGVMGRHHPRIDLRLMEEARFARFLQIPPARKQLPVLVEMTAQGEDQVRATLLSRVRIKAMSRLIEHGSVCFGSSQALTAPAPVEPSTARAQPDAASRASISAQTIYQKLVPFGPHYQTLREQLQLADGQAWGILKAPELPPSDPVQELLGSPFPLDGALHAACVLGQQAVDFIPFPVGFSRRIIHRPVLPGERCQTRVCQTRADQQELCFELSISDEQGRLREELYGVRMRDVSRAL